MTTQALEKATDQVFIQYDLIHSVEQKSETHENGEGSLRSSVQKSRLLKLAMLGYRF